METEKADVGSGPQQGNSEGWRPGYPDPMRRPVAGENVGAIPTAGAPQNTDQTTLPDGAQQSTNGAPGAIPWASTVSRDQSASGFSPD